MDSSGKYTPRAGQLKAQPFAIGRAQVKQIKADHRENKVRRPGRHQRRNPVAFAEREKKVSQKIHREYKNDRTSDAGQYSTTRITDAERRRDADHDQAR